ncbi:MULTISPECIES: hypothetical protein [Ralstonia solanacearum species complex]|uniref:hypothetical protein n=1 Tax=Ralstonia solanacearum species complex TaxID=3116862 RepID=UPI000E57D0E3|nr:hypothetical protein [Ralstonia solanacearum]BEU72768.1 hypothetical protein MAFF211271_23230 [Ralstonia pseudosolanacearum]AXV77602.1 hypothetical protein CJO76_11900 [Ralstonia solanacearum]AXV91624.1 hypothetical protein CJO79_11880 [Ralstonia solanacearum]AXW19738.1 hypothetical protein CJO85_11940 [Ralstonia solanacearum]AXW76515.1 hypothetical protein CJO97_11870 [Ralstonia solanacearum]
MKLLVSSPSLGLAAHWQNVLAAAGIRTELRNIYLSSVAGDIPPQDCAAQVWLVHPEQEAQAQALLDQARHPPAGPGWRCPHCGEEHEPQFAQCWRCGKDREAIA